MKVYDSYVWGLVFLGSGVSNCYVLGLLLLCLGVRYSYVLRLDFLHLRVSFLMFGGYFSYVWGPGILTFGVLFSSHHRLVILTFGGKKFLRMSISFFTFRG